VGVFGGDTVTYVATTTLVKGARATRSTIFLKMLMAGSGIVFIGFVLLHMYGNLKAFSGHDAYDEYAHHLRIIGEPMLPESGALWIIRAVLIVSLVVHVYCAAKLWKRAKSARTIQYQVKKHKGAIFASRLMRWGGVTLLLFIIWHLLNFTIGKVNVTGAHLHHGVWSATQTLGLTGSERTRKLAKRTAFGLAVLIAGGFSLVPIFVLAGVITK
jgi:succinate dehydrogenase / fumarate reductase cytochrome b subunit